MTTLHSDMQSVTSFSGASSIAWATCFANIPARAQRQTICMHVQAREKALAVS